MIWLLILQAAAIGPAADGRAETFHGGLMARDLRGTAVSDEISVAVVIRIAEAVVVPVKMDGGVRYET